MDAVVRAVTAPLLDRIDEIMGRSTGVTTALEIARLLNDCRAEIARLRAELEAERGKPDFLSQALNEGDGVYRP